MIELEHSPLGGSAAHRFMNCEGSFLLQRELIEAGELENIESEYAKLGTAAHELGAKAIATGTEPFEFLGEEFNGYLAGWPGGISLDAVQVYFSECMGILARRKARGNLMIEQTIHRPDIHPLLRGTVENSRRWAGIAAGNAGVARDRPAEFLRRFRSARRLGNHGRLCARLGYERIAAPHEDPH